MSNTSIPPAAELSLLEGALLRTGLRVVARVRESGRAADLALALSPTRLAAVRCVEIATSGDHSTLATMVADGDFAWAGLLYSNQPGTNWPGEVEAFHRSDISKLIERLHELKRAAAS